MTVVNDVYREKYYFDKKFLAKSMLLSHVLTCELSFFFDVLFFNDNLYLCAHTQSNAARVIPCKLKEMCTRSFFSPVRDYIKFEINCFSQINIPNFQTFSSTFIHIR